MNPYADLPGRNFWSPAVGKRNALDIDELWLPKWEVTAKDKVVTFGSCFAQHFRLMLAPMHGQGSGVYLDKSALGVLQEQLHFGQEIEQLQHLARLR